MTRHAPQVAGALAIWVILGAGRASAGELREDLSALRTEWATRGRVEVRPARFFIAGRAQPLLGPWGVAPSTERCLSVAVLASPGVALHLQGVDPERDGGAGLTYLPGGVFQTTRCGARIKQLERATLSVGATRGTVETILLWSDDAPPDITSTLPGRLHSQSPRAVAAEVGPHPEEPTLALSVRDWTDRMRAAGARSTHVKTYAPIPLGIETLTLGPGCHLLTLMGEPAAPYGSELEGWLTLDERRTVHQASRSWSLPLRTCVGRETQAVLRLAGLEPLAAGALGHAEFPLPSGLHPDWGNDLLSRFAEALFTSQARSLKHPPVVQKQAGPGVTQVPLELEAGACYMAAVVGASGDLGGLEWEVPGQQAALFAAASDRPAALSFCTAVGSDAPVIVRLSAVNHWRLAVWRLPPSGASPASGPTP